MEYSKKKIDKSKERNRESYSDGSEITKVNKYGEKPHYQDFLPQIKQKMKLVDRSNEVWRTKASLSELRSEIERMDEKVSLKEFNMKRINPNGKVNLTRLAEYGEDLNKLYLNSIDAKLTALNNKKGNPIK